MLPRREWADKITKASFTHWRAITKNALLRRPRCLEDKDAGIYKEIRWKCIIVECERWLEEPRKQAWHSIRTKSYDNIENQTFPMTSATDEIYHRQRGDLRDNADDIERSRSKSSKLLKIHRVAAIAPRRFRKRSRDLVENLEAAKGDCNERRKERRRNATEKVSEVVMKDARKAMALVHRLVFKDEMNLSRKCKVERQ